MSESTGPVYKIGGDASDLLTAFKEAQKGLAEMGHAMHAIEGALAFDKIKEGFTEVLTETSKSDDSMRRFATAMRASGQASDPDRFFKLAESLKQVSTFDDDATIAAGGMMAKFKLSQDQIETLMPRVQDLAAFMGKDLAGAADEVGRAVAMGGRGLMALGVAFSPAERKAFDMMTQTQRVDAIMQKLKGTTDGFAAQMTQTASGAMAQYNNAIGDLVKSFGHVIDQPIAAVIREVTGAVQSATEWFDGLSDGTKGIVGGMAAFVGVAGAGTAALASLSGGVGMLVKLWPTLTIGLKAVGKAGMETWAKFLMPLLAVGAAIVATIAAVGAFKMAWDANLGGMRDTLTSWGGGIAAWWDSIITSLQGAWESFSQWFSEKAIIVYAMLTGMSPDEAHGIIAESNKEGAGLLSNAAANLKAAGGVAAEFVKGAAGDFSKSFGVGVDQIKKLAKSMGLDLDALFGSHSGAGGPKLGATAGNGKGVDPILYSLKDLLSQAPMHAERKDANAGSILAKQFQSSKPNVTGDEAAQSAAKFLDNIRRMSGLSADTLDKVISNMHTINPAAIKDVAAHLQGMSDASIAAMMEATGNNVSKVMEMADGFRGMKTAQEAAEASAAAYWDSFEGVMHTLGSTINVGLSTIAEGLAKKGGAAGSLVNNAMSAGAAGGPMAAAGSVLVDIMSQSKSFQTLSTALSNILGNLAQAFNPLFDALGPIVKTVGAMAKLLGGVLKKVFTSLQPVIAIIAQVLDALAPVLEMLMIPLAMFGAQMTMLKPVFELVGAVVKAVGGFIRIVFKGIADFYNGLVEFIAGIFDVLSGIPIVGDAFASVAKSIRSAEVDVSQFDKSIAASSDDASNMAANGFPPLDNQLGLATTAVAGLTNAPEGFNIALQRFQAIQLNPSGPGASANGNYYNAVPDPNQTAPAGNQVTISNVNITNSDPKAIWSSLKPVIERDNYQMTGTTNPSTGTYATNKTYRGA